MSMIDEGLRARVKELRARGLPPKQIARAVGLRLSEVTPLLRDLAREREATAVEPALAGCWVSAGWSAGLGWDGHADWREDEVEDEDDRIPALVSKLGQEYAYLNAKDFAAFWAADAKASEEAVRLIGKQG